MKLRLAKKIHLATACARPNCHRCGTVTRAARRYNRWLSPEARVAYVVCWWLREVEFEWFCMDLTNKRPKELVCVGAPLQDAEFQYLAESNARLILDAFQLRPEDLAGTGYLSDAADHCAKSG